jgi:hypothetical protein
MKLFREAVIGAGMVVGLSLVDIHFAWTDVLGLPERERF